MVAIAMALVGCSHTVHRPLHYACPYTETPPTLDGQLSDAAWDAAQWTEVFRDIEGSQRPDPRFATRVKMTWDREYFYVAAEMEEPHLWAEYTQHDQVVFHQHDFEIFVDPDGDGRAYYEIEVNVLGTIFDLYLHRMYKEGGPADHGWDATGLRTAIHTRGTPNNSTDLDEGWTVEWAIPWSAFVPPAAHAASSTDTARKGGAPTIGDTWRVNFSRVEWTIHPKNDGYEKVPQLKEDNWTWTPQWTIDMHLPRYWGFVTFEGAHNK